MYVSSSGTVQEQDTLGFWTLDDLTDINGEQVLKCGAYCAVGSLTLPENIKAEGFTAKKTWENLCSGGGYSVGYIDSEVAITGEVPCGFHFTEIKDTDI